MGNIIKKFEDHFKINEDYNDLSWVDSDEHKEVADYLEYFEYENFEFYIELYKKYGSKINTFLEKYNYIENRTTASLDEVVEFIKKTNNGNLDNFDEWYNSNVEEYNAYGRNGDGSPDED